jgi:hypothetical protein
MRAEEEAAVVTVFDLLAYVMQIVIVDHGDPLFRLAIPRFTV